MTWPEQFVDIDFETTGLPRGCNPETGSFGQHCPLFSERFRSRLIPRGEWSEIIQSLGPNYERHKSWQYDQRQEGTCTSQAGAGCYSYLAHKAFGIEIAPAPISLYKFCAPNPNSGSTTSCILRRARDHGMLLIDTPENRAILEALGLDPNHVLKATGYYQKFPDGWQETASQFKIDEFYELGNVDEMFSAMLLGFDILYGRAGHAIHGVDVIEYKNSFACEYDNSWGDWGRDGFGLDTYGYLHSRVGRYGAYAIQSIRSPDNLDFLLGDDWWK